jgi:hypothetical protein
LAKEPKIEKIPETRKPLVPGFLDNVSHTVLYPFYKCTRMFIINPVEPGLLSPVFAKSPKLNYEFMLECLNLRRLSDFSTAAACVKIYAWGPKG